MSRTRIPAEVKDEALRVIDRFNEQRLKDAEFRYGAGFRGKYLYLHKENFGRIEPVCRLEYAGAEDGWDFAIYKYSAQCYDREEWMFPGSEHVDGTIEGALKAGMEAYR